jgi:hypothetical protein
MGYLAQEGLVVACFEVLGVHLSNEEINVGYIDFFSVG